MPLESFVKNIDADYHQTAQRWRSEDGLAVSTVRYFGEDARENGVYAEEPERSRYQDHWLRRLKVRPEEFVRGEKVRAYADDRWALQRIFADQKAPMEGLAPATVQKAFETSTLQSLFPIFFDTQIVAGILRTPILDQLIVENIPVNSHTATHLELQDTDADMQMGETGEGATMVQLLIKEREHAVKLRKFGGELLATYEVLRLQRLPVLARALERIGRRFMNFITDMAISTLIDGDGTTGSGAATTVAAGVAGAPTYADWVSVLMSFSQNYDPDKVIFPKEVITKLLNLPQFIDPLTWTNPFQRTGQLPNPLGLLPLRWDVTGKVTTYGTGTLVVIDSDLALYQYTEGGLLTETDRIIRAQWANSVTSTWTGFAVGDRDAVRVGTGFA